MKIDGVFEGGGVKGLAHLGAIEVMEDAGYSWERVAGTSSSSIVAALLAVGYSAKELIDVMLEFPFDKLEQKTALSTIPLLGPTLSLTFKNGVYTLSVLEKWIEQALIKKGKTTFGDLPKDRLKIVITDISKNRMSILPDDLPLYGIDPLTFPISKAVTMSSGLPFFFVPQKLKGNTIIDGAILSNYPIWIFDRDGIPRWPTLGFRLSGPGLVAETTMAKGPVGEALAIVRTMLEAHDKRHVEKKDAERTVFIKGIEVYTTDFDLSQKEKRHLIELGRQSTRHFLQNWNFDKYIRDNRSDVRGKVQHINEFVDYRGKDSLPPQKKIQITAKKSNGK